MFELSALCLWLSILVVRLCLCSRICTECLCLSSVSTISLHRWFCVISAMFVRTFDILLKPANSQSLRLVFDSSNELLYRPDHVVESPIVSLLP
jgi:hypothetical protein